MRPEKLNVSAGKNADNRIVFLTMRITLTDSVRDTYRFVVTNTIFANGILNKNSLINNPIFEPTSLYCEITAYDQKRIDFFKVGNPLLKVLEYSPDKKILEKKLFTSKTGDLYLRFQLTKNSKYLSIYKRNLVSKPSKKYIMPKLTQALAGRPDGPPSR